MGDPAKICASPFDCISSGYNSSRGEVMPPEYYLGITIAVILIVLLGLLLQRWLGTRYVVLHKSTGTDQLANQLSRIADSLEILVVHLGASPRIEKPSVPLQNAVEPSDKDQRKIDQPTEHHVNLSMFGR
jgi:hypothetical protein